MGLHRKSKYGFLWVTLILFLLSFLGHWIAGWFEYRQEQKTHGQGVEFKEYAIKMTRGTLENWQSEFLQLGWQVAGLAFLWYVGSPQSKESDERKEEKIERSFGYWTLKKPRTYCASLMPNTRGRSLDFSFPFTLIRL